MIREERFVLSHNPYAVDLSTFTPGRDEDGVQGGSAIDAVWFRRQQGATVAYIGLLWGRQNPTPVDAAEFLARHGGEREGGYFCHGRWDGVRYRGAREPEIAAAHLEILGPMLAAYPACPDDYEGWYVVEKGDLTGRIEQQMRDGRTP